MPYIDIHNERVWIPERPLRSMDEARPMRDGDLRWIGYNVLDSPMRDE